MRAMLLHVELSWLVVPAGSAPAFHGYRPRALLLDEGTVMACLAALFRGAKTHELVGVENYDISTFGL